MFGQRKTGGGAAEAKHAWKFNLDNKRDLGFALISLFKSVKSCLSFALLLSIHPERTDEHAGETQQDHLVSPNNPELLFFSFLSFLSTIRRQKKIKLELYVCTVFLPELLEFFWFIPTALMVPGVDKGRCGSVFMPSTRFMCAVKE